MFSSPPSQLHRHAEKNSSIPDFVSHRSIIGTSSKTWGRERTGLRLHLALVGALSWQHTKQVPGTSTDRGIVDTTAIFTGDASHVSGLKGPGQETVTAWRLAMFKIPALGPVWQSKYAYNAGLKTFSVRIQHLCLNRGARKYDSVAKPHR